MDHKRAGFVATEEKNKLPILIIDRTGTLGVKFAEKLAEQFLIVLVSSHQLTFSKNTIHIPYRKKIPLIPDNHYSHMLVFYNGEAEVLDLLPALTKKAQSLQAKLLFITSLTHSSQKLHVLLSEHQYHDMQVVMYGEIFHAESGKDNMVNFLLNQAHRYGRIVIPHDVGKLYPVFLDDVFQAIIAIVFATDRKHRTIFVFPKGGVTELSIARILKKKNPLLKLDFKEYKGKAPTYYIPHTGEYFYDNYPLEKRLQKVGETYKTSDTIEHHKQIKPRLPKRKTDMSVALFLLVILTSLLLPIITAIFIGLLGLGSLYISANQLEKRQIASAIPYAVFAKNALGTATKIGESLFYLDLIAKVPKQRLIRQYTIASTLAATEVDLLRAFEDMQDILDGKSSNPKEDFLLSLAVIKNAIITLQKMNAENQLPGNISTKLSHFETVFAPAENTIDALPALLGFEGKRSYLILFQNNMELRPGGGFIGSYGIITFDMGRINNFKVFDVYDADGKLKTHIEPPFAIRRYLGSSHWFLRDSNFAIDFPTNAQQASTFLKLETGDTVDGVVAVDTNFLKNILSAIGPVTVPDYNETVDKDNFYLLTQNHTEKNFFPGSTQKKDFMRALLAAMQEKLAESNTVSYSNLLTALGDSIKEKHLFFTFSDKASQKLFTVNNLSASLWDGREKGNNIFLDFFGVIDANFGLNKTNYYLKREIMQKTAIKDNGDSETIATVTYTNTSTKTSSFGGDYKNYVRFILPEKTILKNVTIDNISQETKDAIINPEVFTAKGFLPPKELEIEKGKEQGKDTLGFLIAVPTSQTKKVTITYLTEHAFDLKQENVSYDLKTFKQPGTDDDLYDFTLTYPTTVQLIDKDDLLSDLGGKLVYSGALREDMNFTAQFSKK